MANLTRAVQKYIRQLRFEPISVEDLPSYHKKGKPDLYRCEWPDCEMIAVRNLAMNTVPFHRVCSEHGRRFTKLNVPQYRKMVWKATKRLP